MWLHSDADHDFNPRSREGSDFVGNIGKKGFGLFQSTLPRRERRIITTIAVAIQNISIHAPAKGATVPLSVGFPHLPNFNPRSREGSDQILIPTYPRKGKFQSTLPRRERRWLYGHRQLYFYFNPRSREGSDSK